MCQLFRVDPYVAAALDVAVDILLLSDGMPSATVACQRGPVVDVNTCVAKIPSKTMAIVELRSLLRALVIDPGGEEHPRQPSHRHATHVSCPPESAPGQVKLERLYLQSALKVGPSDLDSHTCHIDTLHMARTQRL